MYTIGNIKGLNRVEIDSIEKLVDFVLPQDYLNFLSMYGYGEICENLFFQKPDRQYLKNTFSDCMDLWDWDNQSQIEIALNGLTISTSSNGDIICCIGNSDFPYLLLPRNSGKTVSFDKLDLLFLDYSNRFKFEDLYFDSYCESKRKNIPLIRDGNLDKNLIVNIHKLFLEKYSFDKVFDANTQPKYVIQEIGGWVYFDMIYKNGIRVKYQLENEFKAQEIIEFIEQQCV